MRGRPFTPSDIATLRRLARAGYSDGEIARHLGRRPDFIGQKRRELDIERGLAPAHIRALRRVNARRTVARV